MLGSLCFLIAVLTHGEAAKVVTQTPAILTVGEGQEVVLNCNVQRDESSVSFYRQFPEDTPQLILQHYHLSSSPSFGDGFSSGRFGAKTTSNVNYQLIIKTAEAEDSAEYYCSAWDSSVRETVSHVTTVVFGGGTKLLVTRSDLAPPVVILFPPAKEELQSKEATLVCVATQSFPYAKVTWLVGGLLAPGVITTGPAERQADATYKISSYLTVQTSEWNSDVSYTCNVSLGSQSAQNTISKSKCAT
ncbi:immunoglobulin lambda-1 light chain-like [Corythoichthys intestinalis]|uniref:immunoglobulin lambda-1 light chain-like n=1 Tax=Corythoichthys intestinalis TaxID=161448 RepID=UPI0025A572B1|nr:immunoglobulin lambda-1 light chain-like [Corythoichthys intestinalis]XP_061799522.1 immunoglobulin lambda-1 light chain-like [Nerophis lumbriciformis]